MKTLLIGLLAIVNASTYASVLNSKLKVGDTFVIKLEESLNLPFNQRYEECGDIWINFKGERYDRHISAGKTYKFSITELVRDYKRLTNNDGGSVIEYIDTKQDISTYEKLIKVLGSCSKIQVEDVDPSHLRDSVEVY